MQEDELIETAEVARLLHKTPSAISRMVKRGALEPVKKHAGVRGPFLFRREDIELLVTERAS